MFKKICSWPSGAFKVHCRCIWERGRGHVNTDGRTLPRMTLTAVIFELVHVAVWAHFNESRRHLIALQMKQWKLMLLEETHWRLVALKAPKKQSTHVNTSKTMTCWARDRSNTRMCGWPCMTTFRTPLHRQAGTENQWRPKKRELWKWWSKKENDTQWSPS